VTSKGIVIKNKEKAIKEEDRKRISSRNKEVP